jgi:glycosyltransferase involved in cell wall biosynthesis
VQFTSVPPGDHDAMATLLSGVSLVVLMSDYETHPQVALEAAAARRRILVADDGAGLRELAEDGLASIVAERDSPPAVAAAIVDALAQPAPTTRPRLTAWDDVVDRLMELYQRVARTR